LGKLSRGAQTIESCLAQAKAFRFEERESDIGYTQFRVTLIGFQLYRPELLFEASDELLHI
jgi:hypothetical protein